MRSANPGTAWQIHPGVGLLLVIRHGERGVYPAERVEDILRDLLGVDAVYGVPHVLPGGHYEAERDQNGHCNGIVQSEDGRIDVDVADPDESLEPSENIQHLTSVWRM